MRDVSESCASHLKFFFYLSAGLIEVGVKGEGLTPLITAEDPEPILDIKYISFGSWGSSNVRFFYDCPDDEGKLDTLRKLEILNSSTPNFQVNRLMRHPGK